MFITKIDAYKILKECINEDYYCNGMRWLSSKIKFLNWEEGKGGDVDIFVERGISPSGVYKSHTTYYIDDFKILEYSNYDADMLYMPELNKQKMLHSLLAAKYGQEYLEKLKEFITSQDSWKKEINEREERIEEYNRKIAYLKARVINEENAIKSAWGNFIGRLEIEKAKEELAKVDESKIAKKIQDDESE